MAGGLAPPPSPFSGRTLVIVGGPNGSGKTTLARGYLESWPARYLSADDLAEKINPGRPEDAKLRAGKAFFEQVRQAIATGETLVVESTLAGRSFLKTVQLARQRGYRIEILFVFLDSPEVCVDRVRERVRKGGHDVPEVDIRRRFERSLKNFWSLYRPVADSWHLYFNGADDLRPVAAGEREGYRVLDEVLFRLFASWTMEKPQNG